MTSVPAITRLLAWIAEWQDGTASREAAPMRPAGSTRRTSCWRRCTTC